LEPASFDCIISWLTVLHIVDREKLFKMSARLLRQGGQFYTEDFYQKLPLTPIEKEILHDDVYCAYLPSSHRYNLDLAQAGFIVEQEDELTEDWREYTKVRSAKFQLQKGILEEDTYQGLADFYNKIADLFKGGNLGGVRFLARKK